MTDKNFIFAAGMSGGVAYVLDEHHHLYKKLNKELEAKGYITISGRVNKQYFLERTCYGGSSEDNERK